jgi:DNA-binding CsgD family transcriptional regulator
MGTSWEIVLQKYSSMPWLELLVPALVLLVATPCVSVAYLHARSSAVVWRFSLLGFLVPAAGVSLFTAVGVFLRASGIVVDFSLYFVVWNLSFLALTAVAYFALKTALLAVGSALTRPIKIVFGAGTALAYVATLFIALQRKSDLFFPYIGGTYFATSLYLFTTLALALMAVLRRRERLAPEDRKTLRRFLRIFLPLGLVFFTDQIFRTTTWRDLPWPPLLPLAPLALYCFVIGELLVRMRQIRTEAALSASEISCENLALSIVEACEKSPLTPRERKVLVEILKGRGNAAIARDLEISPQTVKNHVYSIFQKTGAGSRKELYLFAVRRGR